MHDLNYCMPDLNYCMPDLNYCGITAELLRNYCGITVKQAELLYARKNSPCGGNHMAQKTLHFNFSTNENNFQFVSF